MDLSQQLELNADPQAIQQINFNENLDQAEYVEEEAKETILDFS